VVQEYRDARKVNSLRLILHGNDHLAIHELAAALAVEYRLPLVEASTAIATAIESGDALGIELLAAGATVRYIYIDK